MSRVSAVVSTQASLSDAQLGQGSWERESQLSLGHLGPGQEGQTVNVSHLCLSLSCEQLKPVPRGSEGQRSHTSVCVCGVLCKTLSPSQEEAGS